MLDGAVSQPFQLYDGSDEGASQSAQDRSGPARELAESLGGQLLGFWFAFGEFDGVFLMEAPDNASAAVVGMAVGSSGAISEVETTVLLVDEAQDAMRKAAAATYRPPGS